MINFVRLFLPPVGIVFGIYFFTEKIDNVYTLIIYFALAFFLNWILDKVIIERLIPKNRNKEK